MTEPTPGTIRIQEALTHIQNADWQAWLLALFVVGSFFVGTPAIRRRRKQNPKGFDHLVNTCTRILTGFYQKRKIKKLTDTSWRMTPRQFMAIRKSTDKAIIHFPGVYILYNETRGRYYVGQGKNAFARVYDHLTGKGNGDVYADYKYGDKWSIRIIELATSQYETLNELERQTIYAYDSYNRGYNKTRGNKD